MGKILYVRIFHLNPCFVYLSVCAFDCASIFYLVRIFRSGFFCVRFSCRFFSCVLFSCHLKRHVPQEHVLGVVLATPPVMQVQHMSG